MDIRQLQTQLPHLSFQENVLFAPYTYMKVGGEAQLYVEVDAKEDLFRLCSYCFTQNVPFLIIGGASNIVVPDRGVEKLVIRNKTSQVTMKGTSVQADSGVVTAVLAKKTADEGLSGLEYFVGVPGTLGGAIYNNSHFTAHEMIGDTLESVEVCSSKGELHVWPKEILELGYDTSIFHHDPAVILSATFLLQPESSEKITQRILDCAKKRAKTQPIGTASSGCMFKNPKIESSQLSELRTQVLIPDSAVKEVDGTLQIAAGFLIDKAGLKGTTVGGAKVSERHATFLVNSGTATASDIDALATLVEQKVYEKFGIKLEREVLFIK